MKTLIIQGARQNNLKNIDLEIPHDMVTVITGVSGSGKSSLAFDTLFAEGQWRYIEGLSTYAKIFIEKLDRPNVDAIKNIRPSIALEQTNPIRSSRSTVGTATELYDYLRLLYAKIGKIYCPSCLKEVRPSTAESVVDELLSLYPERKAMILFPFQCSMDTDLTASLLKKGFSRIKIRDQIIDLNDSDLPQRLNSIDVVVDRVFLRERERTRITDSIEMAFKEGKGRVIVDIEGKSPITFDSRLQCNLCGKTFEKPSPLLFSFNHPVGACPQCRGFGNILQYDEDLIVPNKQLSLSQGAIEPWSKPAYRWWYKQLQHYAHKYNIDLKKPYHELSKREKELIFKGTEDFDGINDFFSYLEEKRYKLHVRVFLSRYKGQSICPSCKGSRLKPEALNIKIGGLNIYELSKKSIAEINEFFQNLKLTPYELSISKEILNQINSKLTYLLRVGLGYLTLDRQTRTLSGGEAQRINLSNQLGSQLVGTLYILDEPSIGLHPRDISKLCQIIKELSARGNTVVVVEHDRQMIEGADFIVELGPGGGDKGGSVVFAGPKDEFVKSANTLTSRYLRGELEVPMPLKRRRGSGKFLILTKASENNLKNIDIKIPLCTFTVITGVSGSGKSTLIYDTLYMALARIFRIEFGKMGRFEKIMGVEYLKGVRMIDQKPIGKTPRSNPCTYIKAFDEIRRVFSSLPSARSMGFLPSHFSFNFPGGRCESCKGEGFQKIEMYFFENLFIKCDDCQGRRYKPEILKIKFKGRNIYDVLNMTVEEAYEFFRDHPAVQEKLQMLIDIGLGYLKLGQGANTLSGGEAQRLKIASELSGKSKKDILYIMDEPTTGLHMDDIKKLLRIIHHLVNAGNTVVVVEHNLEIIKNADYIIDLGPEGGEQGGNIVCTGTPEEVASCPASYTGRYLREVLSY